MPVLHSKWSETIQSEDERTKLFWFCRYCYSRKWYCLWSERFYFSSNLLGLSFM